jgi:hypothetical protein
MITALCAGIWATASSSATLRELPTADGSLLSQLVERIPGNVDNIQINLPDGRAVGIHPENVKTLASRPPKAHTRVSMQ